MDQSICYRAAGIPDEASLEVAEKLAADDFIPAIEIMETRIVSESGIVNSVMEGQPFKLEIVLQCNKPVRRPASTLTFCDPTGFTPLSAQWP